MPEFKRNILNFGCGINIQYEGMLSYYIERFYVVTKLLMMLNFHQLISIWNVEVLFNADLRRRQYAVQYLPNIRDFCTKVVPFIDFYKKQIYYYNNTVHDILTKEIPLILPIFPKNRKERHNRTASNRLYQIGI